MRQDSFSLESSVAPKRLAHVRPIYVPAPCQDAPDAGRLILRDGTTATLRIARQPDLDALQEFFGSLSPLARQHRFFSMSMPPAELLTSLCNSSDLRSSLTLIVTRNDGGVERI